MSQANATRANSARNGRVVDVSTPQAGQSVTVSALAASELRLAFDPDDAIATREGNSLIFVADTGGKVIIADFFAVGEGPLPTLAMPDGSNVGAAEWLAALYPDMDLSTSAGPSSATPPSSGASTYSDDAGGLLDGVDRFGDQEGTGGWGSSASRTEEMPPADRIVALGTAGSGGDGSVGPDGAGGGDEPKPYTPLNTLYLHHYDPVQFVNDAGAPDPKGEYDYTARMATGAAGVGDTADGMNVPDAWNNGDFNLNISADNAAMSPDTGTDAGVVSGVFAANGGKTSIDANNIHIDVTGEGFEGGSASSVVGAVFAQGAVEEGDRWSEDHQVHHAEVNLKAEGDIALSMNITGDTGMQDHSRVTYAAVSASDRGHVTLESGDDVSISITDQTTGNALDAAGVYGIYSGYGLRDPDLPKREDFLSDDEYGHAYRQYMWRLMEQYRSDTEGTWDDEGYTRGTDQAMVDIKAAGDVDVKLDMGSTEGPVSGLRLEYGDARITAGGDINFSTTLRGAHSGEGLAKASAVSIADGGRLDMSADGDVNLAVHGDGRNMSVLYIGDGPIAEGTQGESYSYENYSGKIHGQNVNITGKAGANGVADVNEIVGLEMGGKKNKFLLSAEEKISIDVTTFHHGSTGSATGILVHPGVGYSSSGSLFMNAPEVEVAARIKPADATSEGLAHDTTATALHVDGTYLRLSRGKESEDGRHFYEEGPLEKLNLIAEGGRRNYGINVTAGGDDDDSYRHGELYLQAKELNVRAAGGVADGQGSGSYGIVAKGEGDYRHAGVSLQVGKLSVTVENPVESVGLLADNGTIDIRNAAFSDSQTGDYTQLPLTVVISCSITDSSLLPEGTRAVAMEAQNGGRIDIYSDDWWSGTSMNDSVILSGDVIAQGDGSLITMNLGNGSDSVTINGNIAAGAGGNVSIATGADSDRIEINGDIKAEDGGGIHIDAGVGNDVLIFNGAIDASDSLYITGGDGNDLLVLKAANYEAFEEQFKTWLESVNLESLSCENVIIHGMKADDMPEWLSNVFRDSGVDLQFFEADTNITLVNTADQLSGAFALDCSGADDLLYLRFGDDAEQGLQNLHSATQDNKVFGLETLVLDIANGRADDNLDALLNNLIGEIKGNGTEVRLRMDGADMNMLQHNGWAATGTTTTLDGSEYTVYSHDELGDMYVKLVTTG